MNKTYAWINKTNHLVENMIMWDGVSPLDLSGEYEIAEAPDTFGEWSSLGIGWAYLNGQFIEPPNPNPPVQQQQQQLTGTTPSVIA